MKLSRKPVRKCYSCMLNMGDYCWMYLYPRGQWRNMKLCPAFENEDVYSDFKHWQKQPTVKKRKELRREFFRKTKRPLPRRQRG